MKIKLVLIALLFCCGPLFGQVSGSWELMHDSALDTLTGVAGDSTLEVVELRKSIGYLGGGKAVPAYLKIITQIAETTTTNGEGVTLRDGIGVAANPASYDTFDGAANKDTIATVPGLADVHQIVNVFADPGSSFKYSLKQYDSAVNTDSLTVRRWIYAVY